MSLLLLVFEIFGTFFLCHVVWCWCHLRKFPGPFVAKFTDHWRMYHLWKGDYNEILESWHERYGGLVRIGPSHLSLGDPAEVSKVYLSNPALIKGNMYKALIGWDNGREVAGLETVMDEKLHTMLRRPVASYFTLDSAVRLEPLIDECGENFMFHLRRLGTFDMTQWFRYFSIDTINKIAFSEDLGFMNSGKDVGGTLAALELGFRAWASVATFPQAAMWLRWALSCISAIPLPLVDMASSRVKARCQLERTAGSKVDLLDHYLEASRQYPDVYTQERVVGLTLTTIFAGSETTGVTLINSIYGLLKHPDALAHVQDELHRAAQLGDLSYPPQWKELSKLPYLDATIKEGMRTVGLLRLSLDRTVPGEGIELCGQVIPAGTIVGCLPQVIHHNKGVYGPDAEEFRPSRWLEADEEKRKTMERAAMWFGQGKHICLGQHIARVEMMKILAMLFMRFQVSDTDPEATLSVRPYSAMGYPDRPYFITVKEKQIAASGA